MTRQPKLMSDEFLADTILADIIAYCDREIQRLQELRATCIYEKYDRERLAWLAAERAAGRDPYQQEG